MIATEDVLFIMPKDREMQFPAMAALQMYVNSYQAKMLANTVTPVVPDYRFRYEVRMIEDDWHFFHRMGIELKQPPEKIGFPDSVIELTDERLLSLFNSEKHCGQACAAIAGVECPPLPKIKQYPPIAMREPKTVMWIEPNGPWSAADIRMIEAGYMTLYISSEQADGGDFYDAVVDIAEEKTGVIYIGRQSYKTYAVAAMCLPVIEILPKERSKNWLSKWKSPLYRIIEEDCLDRLPSTLASLEQVLKALVELKCSSLIPSSQAPAVADKETPTAAGASTASNAANTSPTRL